MFVLFCLFVCLFVAVVFVFDFVFMFVCCCCFWGVKLFCVGVGR